MTEDFAVLDFAVVHDTPASVARALGQIWSRAAAPPPPSAASLGEKPSGLLGRLMSRREAVARQPKAPPLLLQPASAVPVPPYARTDPSLPALADSAIRLSAPHAPGADGPITLIELFEDLGAEARLCQTLSTALQGKEIFFFRYSGSLHPGAHFAFHIYRDGRALRRAVSYSGAGDHGEAPWKATDTGMPHPCEADSLPAPEAPASDIMTPERQGAILSALGIEAEALFADLSDRSGVIVLSSAPGGAPLSELGIGTRTGADLRRPPEIAPETPPQEPEPEPQPEPEPEPAPPPAGPKAAKPARPERSAPPPRKAAEPKAEPDAPVAEDAPAPDGPEMPRLSAKGPKAPLPSDPADWEQEVTALLLACVEAALPDGERIAWLQGFTARLESGDVEGALRDAAKLIESTGRPAPERTQARARLRRLYAHLRPDTTG